MAIKMTREQYEKAYGQAPVLGNAEPSVDTQGSISQSFQAGLEQMKKGLGQGQTATNPIQAVESGATFGAGAINTLFSPLAPLMKPIQKGINYVSDRISNIPGVQKFAQSKAGENTERIAEDVANLSTIAGTAAGVQGATVAGGGVGKMVAPVSKSAGKALKSAGEGAYGLTIAPEEATVGRMMAYDAKQPNLAGRIKNLIKGEETPGKPITEAETAARQGLVGTEYRLGVQATQAKDKIWNGVVGPALDKQKGAVNMKSFLAEVEKEIGKVADLTRKSDLKEALQKVKEDYKNVSKVNLKKLQDYKSGWAEFIPEASYKGKPIGSSLKAVHDLMAKKARDVIYNYVGEEGKQAYIDYSNLENIVKAGKKSLTGDPATRSLTRNVWEFVMNKAVTPIATFSGKVLYRTGEGLELIGEKGAKNVKQVLDPLNTGSKEIKSSP